MLTFCGKDSIPTLEELLSHSEPDVREAAAKGLVLWRADRSVGPLVAALQDPDYMVRRAAAYALGTCEAPRAIPPLIEALNDGASRVRFAAAWATGYIGDRRGVPALVAALSDEDASVRWAAAKALGQVGADAAAAIPALERCLSDKGQWEGFILDAEKYRAGESVGPQTFKVADAAAAALKKIRAKKPD